MVNLVNLDDLAESRHTCDAKLADLLLRNIPNSDALLPNGLTKTALLYTSPIRIGRPILTNDEEQQSIQKYERELEQLFGNYNSLKEIIDGHVNVMPLVNALRAENRMNLDTMGIYHPQKVLIIKPTGIFYQYGVMKRGFDVPTSGDFFKLANIGYLINGNLKTPLKTT